MGVTRSYYRPRGPLRRHQAAQHVGQDAAVLVVVDLVERIDPAAELDLLRLAVGAGDAAGQVHARLQALLDADDVDRLAAVHAEGRAGLAALELQRTHDHPDQGRAVDALGALGDDGADAEQLGALRRPVARRAGAVILSGDGGQRPAVTQV